MLGLSYCLALCDLCSNEIIFFTFQTVTTPINSNETHRMKMAASFHQRVVVGEDKPANNNTSRDHHRTPRDSSTSEDRLRVYQEKSREVFVFVHS